MDRSLARALAWTTVIAAAFVGAAAYTVIDARRIEESCYSYGRLQRQHVLDTITIEWSWKHFENRCVYRDPETNEVLESRRPP